MQALRPSEVAAPVVTGWRLWRDRRQLNALAILGADLLALGAALGLAAALGIFGEAAAGPGAAGLLGLGGVWLLASLPLNLTPGWGLSAPTELRRLAQLTLIVWISAAAGLLLAGRGAASTLLLLPALVLAWLLSAGLRLLVRHLLQRAGVWGVPVAVYGGAVTGRLLIRALQENPGYGYRPAAVFDDDPALQGKEVCGVPVRGGTLGTLPQAPAAVLAMPGISPARAAELLEGPLATYHSVVIVPNLFEIESLWLHVCDFGGMLGLQATRTLQDPLACTVKRTFDLTAVLLSAPLWLPLCLLIGAAIWWEDRTGPLFAQRRVGLGGGGFHTWKFRTMCPDAESVLQRTLAADPVLRAEWEANYKLRADPRITRVGRLLRRTSLDELPQLLNVLLGQMSLVGPRPLPAYHHQELPPQVQRLRERVRPGMTGLWQVSGRSEAGNRGMERWDPYYVRNWSPWLDLVILLRTVGAVLRGGGAY